MMRSRLISKVGAAFPSLIASLAVTVVAYGQVAISPNPGAPWPASDALGRKLPTADETGPPRADRFVGIFYFLWHDCPMAKHPEWNGPYDVSRILAAHPEIAKDMNSPLWGPVGQAYYWGEPLDGYYRTSDPWILRRHAHALADAGVDTLIFDTTNAVTYPESYRKLCEVFRLVRQEGGRTPQIVFMVNTEAAKTARQIYDDLYKPGLYRELWFHWQGKPLMICDPEQADPDVRRFFTLRRAHWPNTQVNTPYAWHWETTYPQVYGYTDDPKKPEQVNVSVAHNLRQTDGAVTQMSNGDARGRNFHDGRQDNSPGAVDRGGNFQEQWKRALQLQPPFVMVTGWNEWIVGRLRFPGSGLPNTPSTVIGFCDQFNQEFSRDIEPMRAGHGDNYYWQLAANVRRYKGTPSLPIASPPVSVRIDGPFDPWRHVGPEFVDHVGETLPRDFDGRTPGLRYTNRTGRNDFVALKVARDAENLYFYARTRQPISPSTDPNWMWLLIDTDQNLATGWQGADFIVNRTIDGPGRTWLEKNCGGWQWKRVAPMKCRLDGCELHLAIPRAAIELPEGKPVALDFKWVDNIQQPGNVLDFHTRGDTAPDGRFWFRYRGDERPITNSGPSESSRKKQD
ncbi:MAG: hypothetical protein ABFC63_02725 [Thermoguttaceae bacterium]